MFGTEGILLLIPAVVSLLYKEKTGVYFFVVAAVLFALYLGLGRKKAGEQTDLREGRLCDRRTCVDFMVVVRALPFFLSDCIPNYIDAVLKRFPVLRRPDLLFCRI